MDYPQHAPLTVLYNADCPICRAEIDHYIAYAGPRNLPIRFEPLAKADLATWGLSPEQARKRLHVRQGGAIFSGVPAFRILWAAMPRYRALAWVTGLPGLRGLSGWIYDRLLAPWLYNRNMRRRSTGSRPTGI